MLRLLLGLLLLSPHQAPPPSAATRHPLEPTPCRACHQKIVDSYARTAHAATSAPATATSIKGSFVPGHNRLLTGVPGVSFRMTHRGNAFYETAIDPAGRTRRERMDLVVGSGRRGQTYLYWRDGMLFELPVSYFVAPHTWINSPGYNDGSIDFERVVQPRCLECHSTSFKVFDVVGVERYSSNYAVGIQCSKCHGDVAQHLAAPAARSIQNPAHWTRDQQLDLCALCHSDGRRLRRPAFSYRPGERLDDYLFPVIRQDSETPDVHGDQVGLLKRSKCFRSSPGMTCATCHDVHQRQRDVASFASRCEGCHTVGGHKWAAELGDRLRRDCVDCHMPNLRSRALQFNTAKAELPIYYRSHAIGIYRAVADSIRRISER